METTKINSIKSDIVTIKYKGKIINIDITKELSIDINMINSQLMELPSNYAFLCSLRDKYIKKRNFLEKNRDSIFSELWIYFKNADNRMTNDFVNNKVISNNKYKEADKKFLRASYKADKFISICKAYESRERILQTLSANLRKEK